MIDRQLLENVTTKRHAALSAVFCERLNASPARASLWAQAVLGAAYDAHMLHHEGAEDVKRLDAVRAALAVLEAELSGLSPWARGALEIELGIDSQGIEAMRAEARKMVCAAAQAGARLSQGRPRGKVNWAAVAVVHEARQAWRATTGRDAPRHLRSGKPSPFAQFLNAIFEAAQIGADPRSAMKAWKEVHDKGEIY